MQSSGEVRFEMGNENFLMRGSTLRLAEWIEVLVIFTGQNCKIYQAKPKTVTKFSLLQRKTKVFIVWLFVVLLSLSLIMTLLHYLSYQSHSPKESVFTHLIFTYFSWILNLK